MDTDKYVRLRLPVGPTKEQTQFLVHENQWIDKTVVYY